MHDSAFPSFGPLGFYDFGFPGRNRSGSKPRVKKSKNRAAAKVAKASRRRNK